MKEFVHLPVMLDEVLSIMDPAAGHRYVDGTVGGGGHSAEILRRIRPHGWLLGCDHDAAALAAAHDHLKAIADCFELRQGSFAEVLRDEPTGSMDGALVDLGVSSHQIDIPERGFSFQSDGPLDMRMDPRQGATAADLLATLDEQELASIFWRLGGERHSRKIARAICEVRVNRPFSRTVQLAELIARVAPNPRQKIHPATRVFQALRMAVNREVENIEAGLSQLWRILRRGGKLAVITFHSVEVQLVRRFYQPLEKAYIVDGPVDRPEFRREAPSRLRRVTRRAVVPGEAECRRNPRARSAQLRVFEKLETAMDMVQDTAKT